MIEQFQQPEAIADAIIERVGREIILALPLGLGKAVHIVNALVERAQADSTIDLQIFTALTLQYPQTNSALKRRFLGPAKERLFGKYPEILYARLLREAELPDNIRVNEFFLFAGQWLNTPQVQQSYIPANYTHALRYILDTKFNVLAQLVAEEEDLFSLSGNTDISFDLLKARTEGDANFVFAAQVNSELPFMEGEALVSASEVDFVLKSSETDFELYSAPKRPVSLADQAIGLHSARLIPDGGTIQIGIGSIGDAVTNALILRHSKTSEYRELVRTFPSQMNEIELHDAPFEQGLYGVSEMFVDGFLHLAKAGILKREVGGAILHGAFFVDCRDFYRTLRNMPKEERRRFQMKPVSFTNELYRNEAQKRKARVNARFINSAMMATARGAIISDALGDGRVVSGVGGQYNFVAQAFALDGARSIITLNATRKSRGKTASNIVWSYDHTTIPWHLRDIVVTEYGIADLRGQSESEAIKRMLFVSDYQFQGELLEKAKAAGKVKKDWNIPNAFRNNTAKHLETALQSSRKKGLLPAFPFGTDFTDTEQRLIPALQVLKHRSRSTGGTLALLVKGIRATQLTTPEEACLERLELKQPKGIKEYFYQKLLRGGLLETRE
ncbi:MAG: acetyl-CoA hydrolase [Bdellovibrionales bacterium]|nr:acetyl-CoA hydrolase [Bdellovibrionales bacterium]